MLKGNPLCLDQGSSPRGQLHLAPRPRTGLSVIFSACAEDISLCDHQGNAQAFSVCCSFPQKTLTAWHVVLSSKTNDMREACLAFLSLRSAQHIFGTFFFIGCLPLMQFPCFALFFAVRQAIQCRLWWYTSKWKLICQSSMLTFVYLSCDTSHVSRLETYKEDEHCRRLISGMLSFDVQKLSAGHCCFYSVHPSKSWVLCRTNTQ